jgi:preprotein translocase subunit SecD
LKALGILLTALLVSMLAVPSFFSEKTVQSWLGATLTLPGIIGIVPTIGIAVDSNVLIGTGPVRGFAVTLGIGIITTVFTAFTLTRLMVAWWVRWVRPQQLAIS